MATRRGFIRQGLVAGGVLGLGGLRAEETTAPHSTDRESGMNIGIIGFPRMDQIDFTGPFEVLSRVPGAAIHVLWKEKTPVRDIKGLVLTPERTLAEAPPLDVLVVPGGGHLIAGKDVTGFSWDEEGKVGREDAVPYNLEEELKKRGARYGKAWMAFHPHVVEDGKLIAGQNPASAAAVGEAVVKRLTEARCSPST